MQGSFEWIIDKEVVCTLSDWSMMFENSCSFFVFIITVDRALLLLVFMKFPSQSSQFKKRRREHSHTKLKKEEIFLQNPPKSYKIHQTWYLIKQSSVTASSQSRQPLISSTLRTNTFPLSIQNYIITTGKTLLLPLRFVIITRSIKLFIYIFITVNWLYIYLYILLLVIRIHFERTQSKETH